MMLAAATEAPVSSSRATPAASPRAPMDHAVGISSTVVPSLLAGPALEAAEGERVLDSSGSSRQQVIRELLHEYSNCCQQAAVKAHVTGAAIDAKPSSHDGLSTYNFHERYQRLLLDRYLCRVPPAEWERQMTDFGHLFRVEAVRVVSSLFDRTTAGLNSRGEVQLQGKYGTGVVGSGLNGVVKRPVAQQQLTVQFDPEPVLSSSESWESPPRQSGKRHPVSGRRAGTINDGRLVVLLAPSATIAEHIVAGYLATAGAIDLHGGGTLPSVTSLPLHAPYAAALAHLGLHFVVLTAAPVLVAPKSVEIASVAHNAATSLAVVESCRRLAHHAQCSCSFTPPVAQPAIAVGADGRVYAVNPVVDFAFSDDDHRADSTHPSCEHRRRVQDLVSALLEMVRSTGTHGPVKHRVVRCAVIDVGSLFDSHGIPLDNASTVVAALDRVTCEQQEPSTLEVCRVLVIQQLLARALLIVWRSCLRQLGGSGDRRDAGRCGWELNRLLYAARQNANTYVDLLLPVVARRYGVTLGAVCPTSIDSFQVTTGVARCVGTVVGRHGVAELRPALVATDCPLLQGLYNINHSILNEDGMPLGPVDNPVTRFLRLFKQGDYTAIALAQADLGSIDAYAVDAVTCFRVYASQLQHGELSDLESLDHDPFPSAYFAVGDQLATGIVRNFEHEVHNLRQAHTDIDVLVLLKEAQGNCLYESFGCPMRIYRRLQPELRVRCSRIRVQLIKCLFDPYDDRSLRAQMDYAFALSDAGLHKEAIDLQESVASAVKAKHRSMGLASGEWDATLVECVPQLYTVYRRMEGPDRRQLKLRAAYSAAKDHHRWAASVIEFLVDHSIDDERKYQVMMVNMYLSAAQFFIDVLGQKNEARAIAYSGCDMCIKYSVESVTLFNFAQRPLPLTLPRRRSKRAAQIVKVYVEMFRRRLVGLRLIHRCIAGYCCRRKDLWWWLPSSDQTRTLQRVGRGWIERFMITSDNRLNKREADGRHIVSVEAADMLVDVFPTFEDVCRMALYQLYEKEVQCHVEDLSRVRVAQEEWFFRARLHIDHAEIQRRGTIDREEHAFHYSLMLGGSWLDSAIGSMVRDMQLCEKEEALHRRTLYHELNHGGRAIEAYMTSYMSLQRTVTHLQAVGRGFGDRVALAVLRHECCERERLERVAAVELDEAVSRASVVAGEIEGTEEHQARYAWLKQLHSTSYHSLLLLQEMETLLRDAAMSDAAYSVSMTALNQLGQLHCTRSSVHAARLTMEVDEEVVRSVLSDSHKHQQYVINLFRTVDLLSMRIALESRWLSLSSGVDSEEARLRKKIEVASKLDRRAIIAVRRKVEMFCEPLLDEESIVRAALNDTCGVERGAIMAHYAEGMVAFRWSVQVEELLADQGDSRELLAHEETRERIEVIRHYLASTAMFEAVRQAAMVLQRVGRGASTRTLVATHGTIRNAVRRAVTAGLAIVEGAARAVFLFQRAGRGLLARYTLSLTAPTALPAAEPSGDDGSQADMLPQDDHGLLRQESAPTEAEEGLSKVSMIPEVLQSVGRGLLCRQLLAVTRHESTERFEPVPAPVWIERDHCDEEAAMSTNVDVDDAVAKQAAGDDGNDHLLLVGATMFLQFICRGYAARLRLAGLRSAIATQLGPQRSAHDEETAHGTATEACLVVVRVVAGYFVRQACGMELAARRHIQRAAQVDHLLRRKRAMDTRKKATMKTLDHLSGIQGILAHRRRTAAQIASIRFLEPMDDGGTPKEATRRDSSPPYSNSYRGSRGSTQRSSRASSVGEGQVFGKMEVSYATGANEDFSSGFFTDSPAPMHEAFLHQPSRGYSDQPDQPSARSSSSAGTDSASLPSRHSRFSRTSSVGEGQVFGKMELSGNSPVGNKTEFSSGFFDGDSEEGSKTASRKSSIGVSRGSPSQSRRPSHIGGYRSSRTSSVGEGQVFGKMELSGNSPVGNKTEFSSGFFDGDSEEGSKTASRKSSIGVSRGSPSQSRRPSHIGGYRSSRTSSVGEGQVFGKMELSGNSPVGNKTEFSSGFFDGDSSADPTTAAGSEASRSGTRGTTRSHSSGTQSLDVYNRMSGADALAHDAYGSGLAEATDEDDDDNIPHGHDGVIAH